MVINTPVRRVLAQAYLVLALAVPILVLLFPGQPPLRFDRSLLQVNDQGDFSSYRAALGEGADKYTQDVVSDLAGVIASAAADYPDGSNALLALFDSPASAVHALEHLKDMIPHREENHDLWASHFASQSGEYVMLTAIEDVLVMIISEREVLARDRLAALPVLTYNANPGLGAVLQQQSFLLQTLVLAFYVVMQWLLLRMLFFWAKPAVGKTDGAADD